MKIQIKPGLEIGDDCPPFVIAEVGSNWKSLDDCLYSIRAAKASGADAVKFQAYDRKALYGIDDVYQFMAVSGHSNGLVAGQLPLDWIPRLKAGADKAGIEFMCSAFSPELIEVVHPYVNIHKVASAELTHVRMLETLRRLGKPVILSTGASGEVDIERALSVLGSTSTVLLYCVAAYPAREVDLGGIDLLRRYGCPVGFSDHTTDALVIPRQAAREGACVLEKHVNFTEHTDTPDAPHSLSEREFRNMVLSVRGEWSSGIGTTRAEAGMVTQHNRRLIATRTIEAGQLLVEGENFGIYRSLKGDAKALSPWLIDQVNGKQAKCKIEVGDGIPPEAL